MFLNYLIFFQVILVKLTVDIPESMGEGMVNLEVERLVVKLHNTFAVPEGWP